MEYPKIIELNDNEIYVDFVFTREDSIIWLALMDIQTEKFYPKGMDGEEYGFRFKFDKRGKKFIEQFFTPKP